MIKVLLLIVSAVIIVLVLMQSGKTDGISGALTGGSKGLSLFAHTKERGAEKALTVVTGILIAVFFCLTFLMLAAGD